MVSDLIRVRNLAKLNPPGIRGQSQSIATLIMYIVCMPSRGIAKLAVYTYGVSLHNMTVPRAANADLWLRTSNVVGFHSVRKDCFLPAATGQEHSVL